MRFLPVFGAVTLLALLSYSCANPKWDTIPPTTEPHPSEGVIDLDDKKTPTQRGIPARPESWQKRPPCDTESGEVALNGACYVELKKTPPCGRALEYKGGCYRPVVRPERLPTSIQ